MSETNWGFGDKSPTPPAMNAASPSDAEKMLGAFAESDRRHAAKRGTLAELTATVGQGTDTHHRAPTTDDPLGGQRWSKEADMIESWSGSATMRDCPDCEGSGRISPSELCKRCNESGILPDQGSATSGEADDDPRVLNIQFMMADYHKEVWGAAQSDNPDYDYAGRETGKKIVTALRELAASAEQSNSAGSAREGEITKPIGYVPASSIAALDIAPHASICCLSRVAVPGPIEQVAVYLAAPVAERAAAPASALAPIPTTDDYTLDDVDLARKLLTFLGYSISPSREPGAEWRVDKMAGIIGAWNDAKIVAPEVALPAAQGERAAPSALVREALNIGLECAQEVAQRVHTELACFMPHKHAAVDSDVAAIKAAIKSIATPAPTAGEPSDQVTIRPAAEHELNQALGDDSAALDQQPITGPDPLTRYSPMVESSPDGLYARMKIDPSGDYIKATQGEHTMILGVKTIAGAIAVTALLAGCASSAVEPSKGAERVLSDPELRPAITALLDACASTTPDLSKTDPQFARILAEPDLRAAVAALLADCPHIGKRVPRRHTP